MSIIIHVTQKDIRKGYRLHASCDPIANAMRRAGFVNVTVGVDNINCSDKDLKERDFNLPPILQQWVKDFDEGKRMRTIEFEIPD